MMHYTCRCRHAFSTRVSTRKMKDQTLFPLAGGSKGGHILEVSGRGVELCHLLALHTGGSALHRRFSLA